MVSDNASGETIKAERAAFEVALTFDGDWFVKALLQGECSSTFSSGDKGLGGRISRK